MVVEILSSSTAEHRGRSGQGMDQDTTDSISIAGPLPLTATPNHRRVEPVWPTPDPIERETLVARDRAEQPLRRPRQPLRNVIFQVSPPSSAAAQAAVSTRSMSVWVYPRDNNLFGPSDQSVCGAWPRNHSSKLRTEKYPRSHVDPLRS